MSDFSFLLRPLVLWACLFLLSRLVGWTRRAGLADRLWPLLRLDRNVTGRRVATALSFAQRLLADLSWVVLILGLLAAAPRVPEAVSALPDGPDLASWEPYVEIFGSLALWGSLVLVPLAIVRAVAEVVPAVGALLAEPRPRLLAVGIAYILLSDGGVLNVAIAFDGTELLLAFAVVLALSYGALVVRKALRAGTHRRRLTNVLHATLLVLEAGWLTVALVAVARLPATIEPVLTGEFDAHPNVAASYLASFDALTSARAVAVLLPFALLRALGVFQPAVEKAFGFPTGRLAALGIVYVVLSDNGVLATALGVSIAWTWELLSLALALSYAGFVLRNVAGTGLPGRYAPLASVMAPLGAGLSYAFAAGIAVWVGFNHLPIASAALLDHAATSAFGEVSLPHFGMLYGVRYPAVGLAFALGFALGLPTSPAGGYTFRRMQPLMSGVGHSVAGCLAWVVGSTLSPLGHGLALGGAASGTGMFALAAVQLANYGAASSNRALAFASNWLLASTVRGFMLGASFAVYLLFLRPVLYEALWFAALFEYVALLSMLLLISMYIINQLRLDTSALEETAPRSSGWSHHLQTLETKADPRSNLTSSLRHRFVDNGDWKPLATYLMGLLYRHGASLEDVRAVCRPLRAAASVSRFLRSSPWKRMGRRSALEVAQGHAEKALASPTGAFQTIEEDKLREAAGLFVDHGTDRERFAVALIAADYQRGADLQQAMDGWFSLLDAAAPRQRWFTPPWMWSGAKLRDRQRRLAIVDDATALLFGSGADRPGSLGWLPHTSHRSSPNKGIA